MTDCVYYHEIMTLDVLSSHPFLLFPLLVWPCSYVPDSCRVGKKCAVPLQGVKRERERGGDKFILRKISLFLLII